MNTYENYEWTINDLFRIADREIAKKALEFLADVAQKLNNQS